MRDQTHLFMMEIELHLDGRSPSSLSLEWDNFFNGAAHQLAAAINSDTVPCKLFQVFYYCSANINTYYQFVCLNLYPGYFLDLRIYLPVLC